MLEQTVLDRLERYRLPLLVAFGLALLAVVWLLIERANDAARPLELVATDAPPGGLKVEVSGAVQRPGVYQFEAGARVEDAIAAAGGPTADAGLRALNMAARLRDEQRLIVPTRQQVEAVAGRTGTVSREVPDSGLVDLNSADEKTLETLPGIGQVRARRIVDSRQAEGPFASPEELLERNLLPRSVFEQVRDRLVAALE